ncbi:hypothetical protein [Actinacidiphila cocklensis]|uniref:hypothetical protein n=1 Tax=Actinacidiphila cocklensis TaxID=887465 RepID=UPI0030EDF0CA
MHELCPPAEPAGQRRAALVVDVCEHHRGALVDEAPRRRRAEQVVQAGQPPAVRRPPRLIPRAAPFGEGV